MPDQIATRSPRRLVAAGLALASVAIAAPLGADRLAPLADARVAAAGWSLADGWAMVVLGLLLGALVTLLAQPRWGALALAGGAALALVVGGTGVWLALRSPAAGVPPCGPADPLAGAWHVAAHTSVDGTERDQLALDIQPTSRSGERLLASLLRDLAPVAVEDRGVEGLGADRRPARHCRALVSGSQVTAALPLLANGAGLGGRPLVPAALPVWRGDFDWWVAADGQLVAARFRVGGHPNDAWPDAEGNQGLLVVELTSSAMMHQ